RCAASSRARAAAGLARPSGSGARSARAALPTGSRRPSRRETAPAESPSPSGSTRSRRTSAAQPSPTSPRRRSTSTPSTTSSDLRRAPLPAGRSALGKVAPGILDPHGRVFPLAAAGGTELGQDPAQHVGRLPAPQRLGGQLHPRAPPA